MTRQRRTAFTRLEALVVVALLGVLFALGVPLVLRARLAAKRQQSENNLRQLAEATIRYAENDKRQLLPLGWDEKHFSTVAKLLPYLGEKDLYKTIDFSRSIDDPKNEAARRTRLEVVLSPLDDEPVLGKDPTKVLAPTSYLFNGLAFPRGYSRRYPSSFINGTSSTVFVAETLRGDGRPRAVDVRRQHIVLSEHKARKYPAEKREEMGVAEFKSDVNVAADRCSSWMDGRMLQGTFISGRATPGIVDLRPDGRPEPPAWVHSGKRYPNDERPDVVVQFSDQLDGLAAPRSLTSIILVGMGDGSVRRIDVDKLPSEQWMRGTDVDWCEGISSEW